MTEPALILAELEAHAQELDDLSSKLAEVERRLVPVETEYEEYVSGFEEGLWHRHTREGEKFPPEALRTRLAHREMDPSLLGKHVALQAQRRRMKDRISSLKAVVDAKRSILSALKEASFQ